MKNQKETIRKLVGFLNNGDEDGGFWLPNIQRPFVWSEEQICRLFDSILRQYPISTLLVWKTTSGIRRRKFIDNWKDTVHLSDFYVPEDSTKKNLVLDGQQRLQSLFIGLRGSFNGKELYFNMLSGDVAAPDDVKYRFKFLDASAVAFPWMRFKELIATDKRNREMIERFEDLWHQQLSPVERNRVEDHLELINQSFKQMEMVTYQELDSIEYPKLYTEEDVVEIFIRANAGGTKLGKSDLLFSLLSASWDTADEKMDILLETLNRYGFGFDRDFVLKTCLVLLDQGARYEVAKFRKAGVRENMEKNWDKISQAIQDVLDFVRGRTYIQCDKALPSYLVLIPLVYVRYHFPEAWKESKDVDAYLLRSLLATAFSGQSDNLLDALVKAVNTVNGFSAEEAFNVIRSQGRRLELTEDRLLQMGYGSNMVHLLLNLWYRGFNHTPAYENNLPQVDHIFPQSALKQVKEMNSSTGRKHLKYPDRERNQLANCMLLTREENGAGGKGDTLPDVWFANKDRAYLDKHLIPSDPKLWQLDRFEDFIVERQKLIREHFKQFLIP